MSKVIDMVGFKAGHLTVVTFDRRAHRREYFWRCRCACGDEVSVRGTHLRNGRTVSCGCVHGVHISDPLTHEELLRLVHYDPATGIFTRLVNSRKYQAGDRADKINPSLGSGYYVVVFNKKMYLAHVLAWFYMTGYWPDEEIDHKNNNGMDNYFDNLREATHRQNTMNRVLSSCSTTGFKGVSAHQGRFRAYITGKHIGMFATPEEAAAAYDEKARELFGEFARTNFEAVT